MQDTIEIRESTELRSRQSEHQVTIELEGRVFVYNATPEPESNGPCMVTNGDYEATTYYDRLSYVGPALKNLDEDEAPPMTRSDALRRAESLQSQFDSDMVDLDLD